MKYLLVALVLATVVAPLAVYAQEQFNCDTSISIRTYLNAASDHIDDKDYAAAVDDLTCALRIDPRNVRAYQDRGYAYLFLEQYVRAFSDFDRAVELAPEDYFAYMGRGFAYRYLNKYHQAIADFTRAIELEPENAEILFYRGNIYLDIESYDLAIADYERALKFDPEFYEAYRQLGVAHDYQGDPQAALDNYRRYLELAKNPDAEIVARARQLGRELADQVTCTVTAARSVNKRAEPSTSNSIQGFLPAGQPATVDSQFTDPDGVVWWHLADGGWVRSDVVTASRDCTLVPEVKFRSQQA